MKIKVRLPRVKIPVWMAKRWKWTRHINKNFQNDMDELAYKLWKMRQGK
jgi:hypothetical protein